MSKSNGTMGVYKFAREMRWSVDWVYKQIQAGNLKAVKEGRKWAIPEKELERCRAK
jgi:hypothetical protein